MQQFIDSKMNSLVIGLLQQALYIKPKKVSKSKSLYWDDFQVSDRSIKFKITDYGASPMDTWIVYSQKWNEYINALVKELLAKWGE